MLRRGVRKQSCGCAQTEGRVRDSADWLFKCIAEAYSVLTDPAARHDLDIDLARQNRRGSASATRSSPARHYSTYRCRAPWAQQRQRQVGWLCG